MNQIHATRFKNFLNSFQDDSKILQFLKHLFHNAESSQKEIMDILREKRIIDLPVAIQILKSVWKNNKEFDVVNPLLTPSYMFAQDMTPPPHNIENDLKLSESDEEMSVPDASSSKSPKLSGQVLQEFNSPPRYQQFKRSPNVVGHEGSLTVPKTSKKKSTKRRNEVKNRAISPPQAFKNLNGPKSIHSDFLNRFME